METDVDKSLITDFKSFSSFDRELRVGKYQVNNIDEQILDALNVKLEGLDDEIKKVLSGPATPSILITGAPRSGTTLISQLLPARYDLGYVSNLMARFYRAPLTGAWLQQKLMPNNIHELRQFSSQHGVTMRVYEPHEYGYFWSRYLNFGANCHEPNTINELAGINFPALTNILADISRVFSRPTIYKCTIAPFLLDALLQHTGVFVVHIVRERDSTIDSVLRVREQRLGDISKWWSIRPYGWEKMQDRKPWQQVAWQYDRIINAIRQHSLGDEKRVYEVQFENLIESPEYTLEQIMESYSAYSGISVSKVGEVITTT